MTNQSNSPVEVRSSTELERRHPERAAFEAWAAKQWGAEAYRHTSATSGEWEAWKAARASLNGVRNTLVQLAADCAQRKPLRGLEPLTEVTHIGHRQFARAYEQVDEAVRKLACDLRDAADAL